MPFEDAAVSKSLMLTETNQPSISIRSLDVVRDLVNNVKVLTTQKCFTEVENMVTEAASLRHELKSRLNETKKLKDEIENLKVNSENKLKGISESHSHTNREILKVHRESMASLEAEKKTLQTESSTLQAKLDEEKRKATDLQKLNLGLEQRNADYANQRKEDVQKSVQAKNEIQEIRTKLRAREEQIDKDKESLRTQGALVSKLKSAQRVSDEEKTMLSEKLKKSETELQHITSFTQKLSDNDPDDTLNRLQGLWQSCLKATRLLFEDNLSESILREPGAWRRLKEANQVTHLTSLPPSNSREAKQMRTLVVLAILAASLTQHIFTPTYFLKEDSELRQILLDLAEINSEKEAFCRGLLLSISEGKQSLETQVRVSTVIREVSERIQDLVTSGTMERFRSELGQVVETAAQTWATLQRRRNHYEVGISVESEDWNWQEIEFKEDDIEIAAHDVSAADLATNEAALVLFPRVFIVDQEADTPVFPGVLLRRSQTIAADREMEQIKISSPSMGSMSSARSGRPRRMTFNRNSQNGTQNQVAENFLGQERAGSHSSGA